jgi:DNA polymerase-1
MPQLFSGVVGAVANGVASTGTKYETIQTLPQLNAWIDKICKAGHVSFDTETDSLLANQANIVGMSLAVVRGEAAYIPLGHDNGEQLALHDVLEALKPVLENPCIMKIMHNGKYDWLVMKRYGVTIHPIEDTMLMSYSQYGGKHYHNMDDLSARYLGHTTIEFKEVTGGRPFNEVEITHATAYAAEDADVTLGMYEVFGKSLLADPKSLIIYRNIEQPLLPVLAKMEREGVLLDVPYLNKLTVDFTEKMNAQLDPMYEAAGVEFNPASAKQLGAVFRALGIDTGERTDTGQMATGAKVLDKLAERVDLPDNAKRLVTHVLEWRKFAKLIGTYTEALPAAINPATGRLHPSFVMAGTITGRLSCSDPNIQNIPIRTPEGALLRNAFVAPPGKVLISADYSQIELRILAEASGDAGLLRAFEEGHDIHAATAALVDGVPIEKVSKTRRRDMKAVNFGIAYGTSQYGLARTLGVSVEEAEAIIAAYFERFSGIKSYMDKAVKMAQRNGFVRTRDGRRIWIEDINHKFRGKRGHAERQAVNGPIQGTAADMIKRAMIAMDWQLWVNNFQTKMLLQVHDELIFEAPENEVDRVVPIIKHTMEAASTMKVKVIAEVGVGPNWGEAH